MKKLYAKKCAALLLILLVAVTAFACSGKSAPNELKETEALSTRYSPDRSASVSDTEELASVKTEGGVAEGRKLIKNVFIKMQSLEYGRALSAVKQRCADFGGYIDSENENGVSIYSESSPRSDELVMRIPAEKLGDFLSDVETIGNVYFKSSSSEDVTESYYDIEARLESLEIQEERYLELLKKASSMDDIIKLEGALTDVRCEIESLTGSKRRMDSLISYSVVRIRLEEVFDQTQMIAPSETLGERISGAFKKGFRAFGNFLEFLLTCLITALPFAALAAVIAVAAVLISRRNRRKKAEKKKDAPAVK